jgi:hypothetical protein
VDERTPAAPTSTLREYSPESLLALMDPCFVGLRLFGRRPGPRLREAEAGLDRVRRWDPLGLRRLLVPRLVRHRLGSWALERRGATPLEALSAADVEYFEGVEGSGTLIAVGVRRGAPAG